MLTTLILIVAAFYGLAKTWEWYSKRHVYNIKTGEPIQAGSIFGLYTYFLYDLITGKKTSYMQDMVHPIWKDHQVYGGFFGPKLVVTTNNHKLAQQILQQTETFVKDNRLILSNPMMKRIFGHGNVVFANGEDWKKQRMAINPAFYNIEMYNNVFKEKSSMILDAISKKSDNGVVHDVSDFMQKLTLDVLGKTIFEHDFNSIQGSMEKDINAYNTIIDTAFSITGFLFGNLLYRLGYPKYKNVVHSMDILNELFYKLIDESKQKLNHGEPKTSMLDYLVEANMRSDEYRLTDDELRDNIWIFFIAGHETTSTALSYAINLLGANPEIQEKLRDEIKEFVDQRDISFENIKKCEYLEAVIKETMRLHPPVESIPTKLVVHDTKLGDWFIPEGSLIQIGVYTIQRDEKIYPEADKFKPERWLKSEQAKNKIPSSAWIPFSAGSRVCVGNNFSLYEQKVFLIDMLRRFKIERLSNKPIRPAKSIGLSGPEEVDIRFTPLK